MGDWYFVFIVNFCLFGIRYLCGVWRSYGIRLCGVGGSVNNEFYSDYGGREEKGRGNLRDKGNGCINLFVGGWEGWLWVCV